MTVCRHLGRCCWPLVLALPLAGLVFVPKGMAAESPVGKIIADIVPVNNRLRPKDQILAVMQSRPGRPYDEGLIQEDVRKLQGTKWFTPGGVQVHTRPDVEGRILVFLYVTEVTNTVQEVIYEGVEHIGKSDLHTLAGVRKGDPMNPLTNEQGRAALLRRYLDDGRAYASVELVEGNRATDSRVIYRVVEGPVVKVGGFGFQGNDHAMAGRLKTQLATKATFLGIGGKFNPMSLDADRQKLIEYYHGLGFLRVQIFPEVVPAADLRTVRLVYHINEGVRYNVANRQIEGNKTASTAQLNALATLKNGDRYDGHKAEADLARIKDYFGYRGHMVGVQQAVFEVPDQPGVVNVSYQIEGDRGMEDRIGNLRINGNVVTQDRVILNQLQDLRPGQVLQYPQIKQVEARLARLGIFDADNPPHIDVIQQDFDSLFKDLVVNVQETRTGQFMVGAGVNSNSGVNGQIVINERNFDIFRFPMSWDDFRNGTAFRGNGQEFRIEAVPSTTFQRYTATFREPYLFDTQFGFTNSIYYFQRQYVEYEEERVGMRTTIDRRLDPIWKWNVSTRIEDVDVKNLAVNDPPSITGDAGHSTLFGIRTGFTRDSRDSYLYPTNGSLLDFGVEQVYGSYYQFPEFTADYTKFLSSKYLQREDGSGKHVLALRTKVAVEGGNAPVFERFYAGGFGSLRGFSYRGVGPNTDGAFTGGTFSFLNTIEYQIPVLPSDKLYFVTFLDHGTVEEKVEITNYRVSAGFGFRIAIPMLGPAPLAFDFAFPIVKAATDNKQMFSFYVGLFGG